MGGTLSTGQNTRSLRTDGNNADSLQIKKMDWREEVVKQISKHHNPQTRQLNYERNIRAFESALKASKQNNKSYYKIFKNYLGY